MHEKPKVHKYNKKQTYLCCRVLQIINIGFRYPGFLSNSFVTCFFIDQHLLAISLIPFLF